MIEDTVLIDFKDIETKLGRKVPESLSRSVAEWGQRGENDEKRVMHPSQENCVNSDLKRLKTKMLFLKQEMAHLRATDVKLMKQLLSINEGIESVRWVLEDKGDLASHCSTLSDSQDASPHGSCDSLHAGSNELDDISLGSYLDTLAEDFPNNPSPTDLELCSDPSVLEERAPVKSPLDLQMESDEYYCFG